MNILERCIEKAELEYLWAVSEDEDEDVEIFVDDKGDIFIKNVNTHYNCGDVLKIKFRQRFYDFFETGDEQDYYVKIWFDNGDILVLGMKNFADYIYLLRCDREKRIYRDKELYEYWDKKD